MDIAAFKPVWSGDSTVCPELYREYLALCREYLEQYGRHALSAANTWALLSKCCGGGLHSDGVARKLACNGAVCGGSVGVGAVGDEQLCNRSGHSCVGVGVDRVVQRGCGCAGVERCDCAGGQAESGVTAGSGCGDGNGGVVQDADGAGSSGETFVERGKHYARNKARREKEREEKKKQRASWRSADSGVAMPSGGSASGSVQTVDTRTGVEIEAAQTLAARRVAENNLKILEAKAAAKLVEHRLRALNDKERTLVIDRLAAARLEEKINTSKKRSQASFKECGSPIDSVGSALSAHEFAFKQQIRQIDAEKKKVAYMEVQLKRYHSYSPDYVNQLVADIPEPYIPTEREMEEEDSDESPFLSYEEMQAEAANYQHG